MQGYTLGEVERAFDTRSRDSPFWPLFQLFHTLIPAFSTAPEEPPAALDEFMAAAD